MLSAQDLVDRVNHFMYDELYSYDDLKYTFDDAIDFINNHLISNFPPMTEIIDEKDLSTTYSYEHVIDEDTEETETRPIIPDKYMRQVFIPFVVEEMFRREGEFGNEYQMAVHKRTQGMDIMFRDHFHKIPEEFQADEDQGMIIMDEDLMEEEDVDLLNAKAFLEDD